VIISLVSTQCPTARRYLWNPLTNTRIPCVPPTTTFEDSSGALLGGSIYTALLLSGHAKLAALGTQVGFAINRQALAATQTTNFAECLTSIPVGINYKGELWKALEAIPDYSGPVLTSPTSTTGPQAYTPLKLSPDGQRVICASIAMMSGEPIVDATYSWENNLLWQGSANTANAVFKTIANNPTAVTIPQVQGLCAVARAIWRFTTTKPPSNTAVTIPGFVPGVEVDFSCVTNFAPACAALPFGFTIKPTLAAGHTLMSTTPNLGGGYIGPVCWA